MVDTKYDPKVTYRPFMRKVFRKFLLVNGRIAVRLIFLPTTGGAKRNPKML